MLRGQGYESRVAVIDLSAAQRTGTVNEKDHHIRLMQLSRSENLTDLRWFGVIRISTPPWGTVR